MYYIDWSRLKVSLYSNNEFYIGNAGGAKSQGLELSAEVRPISGLKLGGWIALDDAVLTTVPADIFPPNTFHVGDRMPYASRFSGNLSLEDDFPITGSVRGAFGVAVSYVGDRKDVFQDLDLGPAL